VLQTGRKKVEGRRQKAEGIEGVNLYFLPTEVGVTKNPSLVTPALAGMSSGKTD